MGWELDWTEPYGNQTLGVGRDFLGFWPKGSPVGETMGKAPGRGRREGWGGVPGGKDQIPISPGEGFSCLLREN